MKIPPPKMKIPPPKMKIPPPSFYPLKSGGAVIGGGLALLSIEVTIGVVAEHCGGLTIPTVDHFLLRQKTHPLNSAWGLNLGGGIVPTISL